MIIVYGAAGRLGREIMAQGIPLFGNTLMPRTRADGDVCDDAFITRDTDAFRLGEQNIIINCTAMNGAEACHENPNQAFAVNGAAPTIMARAARRHKAALIHFSTDYVFNGHLHQDESYEETHGTDPRTIYGASKLAGEHGIRAIGGNGFVFRLSSIYGEDFSGGLDAVKQVRNGRGSRQNSVQVLEQRGSPTPVWFIATVVLNIVATLLKRDAHPLSPGLYHLAGAGGYWKTTFAMAAVKAFCPGVEELSIITGTMPVLRPKNTALNSVKLWRELGFPFPHGTNCLDLLTQTQERWSLIKAPDRDMVISAEA